MNLNANPLPTGCELCQLALASVCLHYFICKMGIIMAEAENDGGKALCRQMASPRSHRALNFPICVMRGRGCSPPRWKRIRLNHHCTLSQVVVLFLFCR